MDVRLVMFKENGERKDFPLGEGITFVGRQEDCDLRIPLADISRKHAQLIIQEGTVTIRDMGSSNGTYVNNQRVSEQDLGPGDHIVMGPVVFTLQIDGTPELIRPVKTRVEERQPETPAAPPGEADASAATEVSVIDEEDLFGEASADGDPITALEALAASGEQNPIDDILEEEDEKPSKS